MIVLSRPMDAYPQPPPVIDIQEPIPLVPLQKLPYPPYVLGLAAITLIAFLIGLIRSPHAIGMGVAAARGEKLLAERNYPQAEAVLEPVVKSYPKAQDVRLNYLEACTLAGDLEPAAQMMDWFDGKEVSNEEEARLKTIESRLSAQIESIKDVREGTKR